VGVLVGFEVIGTSVGINDGGAVGMIVDGKFVGITEGITVAVTGLAEG
jgi:hypothetical protein